jgi:hypothetical protein
MSRPTLLRKRVLLLMTTSLFACASSTQATQPPPPQNPEKEWAAGVFASPTAPVVAPASSVPAATVAETPTAEPPAEAPPPPSAVTPDPWPKSAELSRTKYTVYQPQLDSWNDYVYLAHAAVSVLPPGSKDPVFGVVEISANTIVDKQAKAVQLENLTVQKATFPSVPKKAATYKRAIQSLITQGPATMSLARLEAAVGIEGAERKSRRVPVLNEPPRIVFSTSATVLVLIHGNPVWRPVSGTSLSRVLNTRACILSDAAGAVYVHVLNGFMTAPSLNGPWSVATVLPSGAAQTAETLAEKNVVDLMQGPADDRTGQRPSLVNGAPGVVLATQPTEVIITQGPMSWAPLEGTQLLYVQNTNGNVFQDMVDQQYYVLVTGRWFRASAVSGPWSHVAGTALPRDFSLIPATSPKENVLASVPGTFEAQEAAISAEVPQMATVYRSKVSFQPAISGAPVLQPIPDTPLQYVFNSPDAIIMVSPSEWYAVQTGVWFTAPAVNGPWAVAGSVPAVIYSIPPSAPLFYTTFVQIYAATPDTVVVGYTPGYTGVVVEPNGLVVYGTGYSYVGYVGADVWYAPPVTYGYAANLTYTPWTGFAVGFAIGWGVGHDCYAPAPYWGAMPYAYHGAAYGAYGGAAAWGPHGWAATTGNVYHQYGATAAVSRDSSGYNAWTGNAWSSKVGTSYNSVTGRASAGQSASVSNAYNGNYAHTNRGATYNASTGVGSAGSRTTVGNASTGQQTTYGHGTVSGPGGQTTHVAQSGDNYYADHNGNVYNYNSASGQAQKQNSNGSWSNVDKPAGGSSYQASSQAREAGDARSASSSWGGSNWGGGASQNGRGWGGSSGSWGGGETHASGGWGGGGDGGGWGGGGWSHGGGGGGGGGWGGFHGGGGFRR